MIDDLSVHRVIDLDQAVVEIVDRRRDWESAGLAVGPVSWRDEAASWPQRLEADRSRVDDPDSIGVRITGLAETELCVVLFRGGWADVDFIVNIDDAGALPAPDVSSPQAFGNLLDRCVSRVFGSS
ncbi:hypothetical protein [Streptomyces sp. NBC_00996]|uniref:hypothetical protein n=1 Tax=Streptomyces sp. NBC_00996 TaxID=2903710 RepID=UPI00386CA1E6|nr:hypothetical protein OG390_03125 [Streptomyces sp. NBC_00996]